MENTKLLDSREDIAKVDVGNVLGSVEALPDQCLDAFDKASSVLVPEEYKNVTNLVMCGMGGSGLGARIVESVYIRDLKVPLVRVNGYDLPNFVDENSLVFCSSYSGTTEETFENVNQAIARKAKWLAIGTGGPLIEEAKKKNVPYFQIDPSFNPSNQPRMAIGYSLIGQLVLASKVGLFDLPMESISDAVSVMKSVQEKCKVEVSTGQNPAKDLALKIKNKVIMFFSSDHMIGGVHTINNQFNENAKNLTFDYQIPEINHHLLEGLKYPETNQSQLFALFVNSDLYQERNKRRFEVTKDVVTQNKIENFEFKLTGANKLSQTFEFIQFGAYLNLYLSILYGQNPAPIPWVDYFKTQMGQPLGK